ncbi:ExbD/TolR family protein [Nitrincola alkalilacustris]|uniref:ExbD/TolR family protein n=1 Tax=Nitrincola alkalilacustris TaxID=1571224 RepID=UPI0014566B6C|nr:biopolymer transporter ExbD [Nitrincola alkalilacustris]
MLLKIAQPVRRRQISLTPLIDVVFILLLFFMLTSSFVQWRSMELHVSASAKTSNDEPEKPWLAEIQADGTLLLEGTVYAPDQNEALSSLFREKARPVIIRAAAETTTQMLISSIERLQLSGASSVTLAPDATAAQSNPNTISAP